MKKPHLIILTVLTFVTLAVAATITVNVPDADVPRIQEAIGSMLNLGRPATNPEVQGAIKQWLIQTTKDYERRRNMAQYTPPPLEAESPSPTAGILKAAAPTATPKKK